MNNSIQVSQSLGYLWFNAFAFSEERAGVRRTGTIPVGSYQTNEEFFQLTNYDLLHNIYQIIQGIGLKRLNSQSIDEGFRAGYDEKVKFLNFDSTTYYGTYWDFAMDLLEFADEPARGSLSYEIGILMENAIAQSNWFHFPHDRYNTSKNQTLQSFYEETAFDLLGVSQELVEGLGIYKQSDKFKEIVDQNAQLKKIEMQSSFAF